MDNVIEPGVVLAPTVRPSFHDFATAISNKFLAVSAVKNLFKVNIKKGALDEAYLKAIPAEHRQWHTCSCCRSFLNRIGNIVTIDEDGKVTSPLWNLTEAEALEWAGTANAFFLPAMDAMRRIVESSKVTSRFVSTEKVLGTPESGGFNHFYAQVGKVYVDDEGIYTARQAIAQSREDYRMLAEFMGKVKPELLAKARTMFENDAQLKLATTHVEMLQWACEFKETYDALRPNQAKAVAYLWNAVATVRKGSLRIGQGVMGNYLSAVDKGGDYTKAKNDFLYQTDKVRHMKKVAAPTQGNIDRTKAAFAKLDLEPSLARRLATEKDIVLKIWEPTVVEVKVDPTASVFDRLSPKDSKSKVADLPIIKGGVVTMQHFTKEILPTALKLEVELDPHRKYGFVGLMTAVNPDAKPLTYWDLPERRNPMSGWQYKGGVAPYHFDLTPGLVEVTAIVPGAGQWVATIEEYGAEATDMIWLLKGAADQQQHNIPLSGALLRGDLHEFHATLQRYFDTTPLTPLAEGEKPIAGIGMALGQPGLAVGVDVRVTKADAVVTYHIDRSY